MDGQPFSKVSANYPMPDCHFWEDLIPFWSFIPFSFLQSMAWCSQKVSSLFVLKSLRCDAGDSNYEHQTLKKISQKNKTPKNSTPKSQNKPFQNTSWGCLAYCFRLDVHTVNQCLLGVQPRVAPGWLPAPHHPPAQVLSPQPSCPGGLGCSQMWGRSLPANPSFFTTGFYWSSPGSKPFISS